MSSRIFNKNGWYAGAALLILSAVILYGYVMLHDPGVPLMVDRGSTCWIRYPSPLQLLMYHREEYTAYFRKKIVISRPTDVRIRFMAFRSGAIMVDGDQIFTSADSPALWKSEYTVDVPPALLPPGEHEIRFRVTNNSAPPLLRVRSSEIGLNSGADWESSLDEENWQRAERVNDSRWSPVSREFRSPLGSLRILIPLFLPIFFVVTLCVAFRRRIPYLFAWAETLINFLSPGNVRWIVIGIWILLAANNLFKLPYYVGFDNPMHIDYMRWIIEKKSLPLAPDGWQMFQPPLYYLLSSLYYSVLYQFFQTDTAILLLRLIPLACGMMQVQLSYLALRRVFSERQDMQIAGITIGGLLPMNLYICQYAGNEPLSSCLIGAAFYCFVRLGTEPEVHRPVGRIVLAAAVILGLALLTKMTAVLIMPLFLCFMAWELRRRGFGWPKIALFSAVFIVAVSVLSGWFYLRNWLVLGTPFIGGWTNNAAPWWQDPGYRTLGQIFRFGEVFRSPVYSATSGFWNGLYSTFWADGYLSGMSSVADAPPWNYDFMLSGILLGIVPSVAIILGSMASIAGYGGKSRPVLLLAVAGILTLIVAMFHLFLIVPVFSTVKATYASGLTVAFSLLAAAGYDLLGRIRWCGAIVTGLLACWMISVTMAYLIL